MKWVVIVCVLFQAILPTYGAPSDNADSEARLHELKMARQAAEDRVLELNARLVRTQEELDQARAELAETLVETRRLREDVQAIRLKAANVLVNHEDLSDAKILAEIQLNLQELSGAHQQLYRYLLDYQQSLDSVLDVLDPDQYSSLRRLLARKLELIFYQYGQVQSIADLAAEPPRPQDGLESTVLSINEDLDIAVFDAGRAQGLRIGSTWQVTTDSGARTLFRIIEARHSISAALLIEGDLRQVVPGATAKLVIEPGS